MPGELTLEKLKIDERLRTIELQVTRLVAHADSESGNIANLLKEQAKRIDLSVISLAEHKIDFKEHRKEDDSNFKRIDKTIYISSGVVIAFIFIIRTIFK